MHACLDREYGLLCTAKLINMHRSHAESAIRLCSWVLLTSSPEDRAAGRSHFELVVILLLLVEARDVFVVHRGMQRGLLGGRAGQRLQVLAERLHGTLNELQTPWCHLLMVFLNFILCDCCG